MGGRGNRVVNTLLGHKRPRRSAPRGLAKGVTRPNNSRGTMIKYGTDGHPLTPLHYATSMHLSLITHLPIKF